MGDPVGWHALIRASSFLRALRCVITYSYRCSPVKQHIDGTALHHTTILSLSLHLAALEKSSKRESTIQCPPTRRPPSPGTPSSKKAPPPPRPPFPLLLPSTHPQAAPTAASSSSTLLSPSLSLPDQTARSGPSQTPSTLTKPTDSPRTTASSSAKPTQTTSAPSPPPP